MYSLIDSDELQGGYPKPLYILFSDTKGIQWDDTDATLCIARDTSSLARTESELSSAKGTIINQLMKFVI